MAAGLAGDVYVCYCWVSLLPCFVFGNIILVPTRDSNQSRNMASIRYIPLRVYDECTNFLGVKICVCVYMCGLGGWGDELDLPKTIS